MLSGMRAMIPVSPTIIGRNAAGTARRSAKDAPSDDRIGYPGGRRPGTPHSAAQFPWLSRTEQRHLPPERPWLPGSRDERRSFRESSHGNSRFRGRTAGTKPFRSGPRYHSIFAPAVLGLARVAAES